MAEATEPKTTSPRLMSVDALRGFDMFWIIGADSLVEALHDVSDNRVTSFFHDQLEHADWQGFHFYDLIFPLFVFIMGVSTVLSLTKIIAHEGKFGAVKRIVVRSALLFIIALIYSGGVSKEWPNIRVMGVLNRIALCYLFGGLLFCFFNWRSMLAIAVALLLGYWALLAWVPIRDIRMAHYKTKHELVDNDVDKIMKDSGVQGMEQAARIFYGTTNRVTGKYDMGYNLANHLDFEHLGGSMYDTYWDPEGLLSTLPAIVTGLLGIFAGLLLKNTKVPDMKKVAYLLSFGVGGVVLGFVWGMEFPVIKKIWTSSYVLVAGGYSAILLGVFFWVVDVMKFQFWCRPFVWMGMNSIAVYMTSNLIGGGGFRKLATRLAGGDVTKFFDHYVAQGFGELVAAFVGLALAFWFVNFLYRKKIFIRL